MPGHIEIRLSTEFICAPSGEAVYVWVLADGRKIAGDWLLFPFVHDGARN